MGWIQLAGHTTDAMRRAPFYVSIQHLHTMVAQILLRSGLPVTGKVSEHRILGIRSRKIKLYSPVTV